MSTQLVEQKSEAAILARLIQAQEGKLTRDAANYLLSLRFDERDLARMHELNELAGLGTLSAADEAELDSYIHVGDLLAVMQARARRALGDSGR